MVKHRLPAFTALALAACTASTDPVSNDRFATEPITGGLRLGVSVDRQRLVLGDTARVTVSLTNPTSVAVTLHFPTGCQLRFDAERVPGGPAEPEGGGYMCTQALTTLRLEPGATVAHEFPWTHTRFDYPPYTRAFQEPGRVRFHAILMPHDETPKETRSAEGAVLDVADTASYGAEPEVGISATLARSPVLPGDTVSVIVKLRNLRNERVTMRFTSTCHVRLAFFPDHQWWDAAPASVVGEACGDALTSLSLAAREIRSERYVWRAVDASRAPLAEGGYMLRATLGVHAPELRLEAPHGFVRLGR